MVGCTKNIELKQNYVKYMGAKNLKINLKYTDINITSNYRPEKLFNYSLSWQRLGLKANNSLVLLPNILSEENLPHLKMSKKKKKMSTWAMKKITESWGNGA